MTEVRSANRFRIGSAGIAFGTVGAAFVLFWAIGLVLERFAMSLSESEPEFRGLLRASLHGGMALIVIAAIAAITRNVTGWGGAAWVTATLLLVLYFVTWVGSFAVTCC